MSATFEWDQAAVAITGALRQTDRVRFEAHLAAWAKSEAVNREVLAAAEANTAALTRIAEALEKLSACVVPATGVYNFRAGKERP